MVSRDVTGAPTRGGPARPVRDGALQPGRAPGAAPAGPTSTTLTPGTAARHVAAAAGARATAPALHQHAAAARPVARPATPARASAAPAPAPAGWGPGIPLPDAAQSRFSAAFGSDLSDVEVHPEEPAVHALGTRAATTGRHVAFAPGAYRPGSREGDHLLGHELAHVVQQSGHRHGSVALQRDTGGAGDHHEVQAEVAARLAVAGHRAPLLTPSPPGHVQREDPTPFVGPVQRTTLADDYPGLEAALGDADWDALEAAYERRLDVVAPAGTTTTTTATTAPTEPATSVAVPLRQVLSDRAGFVDHDVWPTVHAVLQAGGSDELVGELLRNEMMRRFVGRLPVTRDTDVTIAVADPLGLAGGPNHLEYTLGDTRVGQTDGVVDPVDLDETFGPLLEEIVQEVGREAYKVALATALLKEIPALATAVQAMRGRMDADPGDVALTEIRGLTTRIGVDRRYLAEVEELAGWVPAEIETVGERLDTQAGTVAEMLDEMAAYRRANDPGLALGEYNEKAGTWFAGAALENWEEGGVGGTVVAGLAMGGALIVAFVDAAESLLAMGFHETAIEVSRAWQRGDISRNELDEIVDTAGARAILVGAVTRGVGAATSRVGVGMAARLGLGELSLARATVAGAVSGTLTGPTSLAAQDLFTRGWAATHAEGTAARQVIERGIPQPSQYLVATGTGFVLGGLGGRRQMARTHRELEGQITWTPSGPAQILRVDPSGTQILGPTGGRTTTAPRGRGSVIDLEPVVQPDGRVVYQPVGTVETPVGPMRALTAGEGGTQLVVPVPGPVRIPPGGRSLTGVEVVVVPRGWQPSATDASRLLPAPSTSGSLLDVPTSGIPLLGSGGGGGVVMPSTPPAQLPTGRQAVAAHLQRLAAGERAPATDLIRAHAATQPGAATGLSPLLLPSLMDPFGIHPLTPFGTAMPFGTASPFGTMAPFGPTTPFGTAAPFGATPSGTSLVPLGTSPATPALPGSSPLLALPAPGQTAVSQVLAELPPVQVVTPDTMAWVNTRSGVYHVQGSSRFRRGTAEGVLSTVAEAERSGYRQAGVPLQRGPDVTFEGPATRGEPRYVITGRVSGTPGARGAQDVVPSAGEYPATAPVAGTHRMHPAARDLGFTPTGGYRHGPDYINTVWDRHIERFVKQLDRGSRATDEIWMTTETRTVPGTLRLESKTYRVWAQDARTSQTRRLFEITLEVDWPRWLANPSAQPPPRITVDYVSEAAVGDLAGVTGTMAP